MHLTLTALKNLIDDIYIKRGKDYFQDGSVAILDRSKDRVSARILGSRKYRTSLWWEGSELDGECSCPAYEDFGPCKHMAALGFAVMAETSSPSSSSKPTPVARNTLTPMERIRNYLSALDREALQTFLLTEIERNEALFKKLDRLASTHHANQKEIDVPLLRKMLENAIMVRDYIDYREAADWAEEATEAIEMLGELITKGHAEEARVLTEYALELLDDAIGSIDDSDGVSSEPIEKALTTHLAACRTSKPDPAKLARYLFEQELACDLDLFPDALSEYADVLGAKGVATYRKLLHEAWDALPPALLKQPYDSKRWTLQHMMERLYHDNPRQLAAIAEKCLDSSYSYLKLAVCYEKLGEDDKAFEVVRKGLAVFEKDRTDTRLLEYVIDKLLKRHKHEELLTLLWKEFKKSTCFESYMRLKIYAIKCNQQAIWCAQALAEIKKQTMTGKSQFTAMGASLLIQVLLEENQVDEAYHVACQKGCSDELWLKLASLIGRNNADDAVAIYQRIAENYIRQTNNDSYTKALRLIEKIQDLWKQTADGKVKLAAYLLQLRVSHKPKRNFMKMLDAL